MSDRPSPATPNPEPACVPSRTGGHCSGWYGVPGERHACCQCGDDSADERPDEMCPRPAPAPAPGEAETAGEPVTYTLPGGAETAGEWECSEHMSGAALEPCDERTPHVGCTPRPASSGGTGRPGGDVPVHLLLDVWQAMGGDGEAFHAWWAADPSFPDRWSQIVAAVGGNISGLTADSNPPAGALLDLAIAHQADAALRATVAECADQLRHLADAVRSAGDVPMVRLDADGIAPEPITLADHIWLVSHRLDPDHLFGEPT